MLWEAYQHMMISDAARAAESAESKVERCDRAVLDLQRHVERLSLACQAMWELLREVSDLTEQDIEKKILEIDNRDGAPDGKIGMQQFDCPSCGRKTNSKRESCVICGAPIKRPYPFS
jgi:hypothetical protein